MQTLQLRLHEERKARLIRMKAWQCGAPVVQLPKRDIPIPPPKVVVPEVKHKEEKPPEYRGWFWPAERIDMEHLKIQHVVQAVISFYGISIDEIKSDRRCRRITRPRMVAAYLARTLTTASWGQIGRVLRRDHTTIMYACKKLGPTAKDDPEIQKILIAIVGQANENTQDSLDSNQSGGKVCNDPQRFEPRGEQDPAVLGSPKTPTA